MGFTAGLEVMKAKTLYTSFLKKTSKGCQSPRGARDLVTGVLRVKVVKVVKVQSYQGVLHVLQLLHPGSQSPKPPP